MVINSLEIEGNHPFKNVVVNFNDGFNILFGDNETGKTTIINCILFTLYGLPCYPKETEGLYNNTVIPWEREINKASIHYSLKNGSSYKAIRDFKSGRVQVIDTSINIDITNTFEKNSSGEPLFALKHLGLSKENFLSGVMALQGRIYIIDSLKELSIKIMTASDSDFDGLTYQNAVVKLEKLLGEIGSPENPASALGEAYAKLSQLEDLYKEAEEFDKEMDRLQPKINKLHASINETQNRINLLHRVKIEREIKEQEEVLNKFQALSNQIKQMKQRLVELGDLQSVSKEGRRKILDLQKKTASCEKKIDDIKEKQKELDDQYQEIRESLIKKTDLTKIDPVILDQLTTTGALERTRNAMIETRKKMLEDGINKAEEIRAKYQEEKKKFSIFESTDAFEEKMSDLEVAISKKEILKLKKEKQQRLSQETSILGKRLITRFIWSLLSAVFATLLIYWSFNKGALQSENGFITSDRLLLISAMILLILSLTSWLYILSSGKEIKASKKHLAKVEEEIEQINSNMDNARSQLKEIFKRTDALTIDEVRKKYRLYIRIKNDLEYIENLVKSMEKKLESDTIEFEGSPQIIETLTALGYMSHREKLNAEIVEKFQKDYFYILDLKKREEDLKKEFHNYDKEKELIQKKIDEFDKEINLILVTGSIDSKNKYQQALEKVKELEQLKASINALEERKTILLENKNLEEIDKKIKRLKIELDKYPVLGEELQESYTNLDNETIDNDIYKLNQDLIQKKNLLNQLNADIKSLEEKMDTPKVLDQINRLRKRTADLNKHKKAVIIAIEAAGSAQNQYHEMFFAPQLSHYISDLLKQLDSPYPEAFVNKNLQISIKHKNSSKTTDINNVSGSAAEQVFTALRISLVRMLSTTYVELPLILDSPFTSFDSNKLQSALKTLLNIKNERQIIITTASHYLRDLIYQNKTAYKINSYSIGRLEHITMGQSIQP